jgi:carotenoid cleavage dioxygenase
MMKVNTETGDVVRHDFGNKIAGEAVFIPRGTNGEDDGYLAIYAFDQEKQTSDLVLLDAAHIDAEPVAVIRGVSGLESDGGDLFFCGGGTSGKVRVVRRPR